MTEKRNGMNVCFAIRFIICIAAGLFIFLGIFKVLPRSTTAPVCDLLLLITSAWNGIEAIKNGRKKSAVLALIMTILTIGLLIYYFMTK